MSYLMFFTKVSLTMLEQMHKKLIEMSDFVDFEYVDHRNIRGFCLYEDALHLLDKTKKVFSK